MARTVRAAAFTHQKGAGPRTLEENLSWAERIIDRIAAEKPDIITLTENFNTHRVPGSSREKAEPIDGPTMQRMQAKAKEHQCYIVPGFVEHRGDSLFNTAAVIDRNGDVVGQYDKIHPTEIELENGILPGTTAPTVIETDFGRIGCQICFDANWHHDWEGLTGAGAELILFLSAYPAGRTLNSMATIYHAPIVAANTPTCCSIIDLDGLTLTRQGIYRDWVIADLQLDTPLFHLDFQFDKMEQIRVKYGERIEVRVYEEEAWWRILPKDPSVDVPAIIREFELVTFDDYMARATRRQDELRP